MKLLSKHNVVDVSSQEIGEFGIIFNAKMVQILSGGIYSNEVKAIIRELSTNAYESHQMAGHPNKPFDITLPTRFSPTFRIRDYGIGLSPESIRTLYTMYGASDKDDSNEYTGCFGLGSKVPFCYHTKSFVVTSWYNGLKRSYSCFIGEDGLPKIALISELRSDEYNGVEITIPVKESDVSSFHNEAKFIYTFFRVKPNIANASFEIDDVSKHIKFDGNGWGITDYKHDSYCVMGQVAYELAHFPEITDSVQTKLINGGLILYCPIGAVDIEVSRERLSLTTRTKKTIQHLLNKVVSEITDRITKDIAGATNKFEATRKFHEYCEKTPQISSILTSCNPMWNGEKINIFGSIFVPINIVEEKGNGTPYKTDIYIRGYSFDGYGHGSKLSNTSYNVSKRVKTKDTDTEVHYTGDIELRSHSRLYDSTLFYELDVKTNFIPRIKQALAGENAHTKRVMLLDFKTAQSKKAFCDSIGFDESYIKKISDIPYAAPVKKNIRNKSIDVMAIDFQSLDNRVSYLWNNKTKDNSKLDFYVGFNAFNVVNTTNNKEYSAQIFTKKCRDFAMYILGDKKLPEVYGIKKAYVKNIEASPKSWKNFFDFIREKLDEFDNKNHITMVGKILAVNDEYRNWSMIDYNYMINSGHLCRLSDKSTFALYARSMTNFMSQNKNVISQYRNIMGIMTYFGYVPKDYEISQLKSLLQSIMIKYPMLHCCKNISYESNSDAAYALVDYINNIDKGE